VLSKCFRSERELVDLVVEFLERVGFRVFRHLVVDGIELDVVAVEEGPSFSNVYVLEVKRRPRARIARQVERRLCMADYLYVVVPLDLYGWALRRVDPRVGIMVLVGEELRVLRMGSYLGNGWRIAEVLRSASPLKSSAGIS